MQTVIGYFDYSWFQMIVAKSQGQQTAMNQSDFLAITCNLLWESRKNCVQELYTIIVRMTVKNSYAIIAIIVQQVLTVFKNNYMNRNLTKIIWRAACKVLCYRIVSKALNRFIMATNGKKNSWVSIFFQNTVKSIWNIWGLLSQEIAWAAYMTHRSIEIWAKNAWQLEI